MKKNFISMLMALTLVITFAAVVPASANQMRQQFETLKGVLTSELTLKTDNGSIYSIIGTDQTLGKYIGHEVQAVGLVDENNPQMHNGGQIRIEHLTELS